MAEEREDAAEERELGCNRGERGCSRGERWCSRGETLSLISGVVLPLHPVPTFVEV